MPLRLFRSWERSGAYLVRLLYMGAMIGFFFFTTQYLQGILGFSPLQAGLAFLPMTLVNFIVALSIPRVVERFGNTAPLIAGVALTLAGMVGLSQLTPHSVYLRGSPADAAHRGRTRPGVRANDLHGSGRCRPGRRRCRVWRRQHLPPDRHVARSGHPGRCFTAAGASTTGPAAVILATEVAAAPSVRRPMPPSPPFPTRRRPRHQR